MTARDDLWRKSTFSGDNAQCVEIARPRSLFRVRDSKNADGPELAFAEPQGLSFLAWVKG